VLIPASLVLTARPYKKVSIGSPSLSLVHLFDRDARDCFAGESHTVVATIKGDEGPLPLSVELEYSRDRKTWDRKPMSRAADTGIVAAELPTLKKGERWFYRFVLSLLTPSKDDPRKLQIQNTTFRLDATNDFYVTFEGRVPPFLMLLHVSLMIAALILFFHVFHYSVDTLVNKSIPGKMFVYSSFGTAVFCISAFIIGPIASEYAFGAPFGPWPIGTDITDTKSLVMAILWISALICYYKPVRKAEALGAPSPVLLPWLNIGLMILSLVVYLIPHSVFIQN